MSLIIGTILTWVLIYLCVSFIKVEKKMKNQQFIKDLLVQVRKSNAKATIDEVKANLYMAHNTQFGIIVIIFLILLYIVA